MHNGGGILLLCFIPYLKTPITNILPASFLNIYWGQSCFFWLQRVCWILRTEVHFLVWAQAQNACVHNQINWTLGTSMFGLVPSVEMSDAILPLPFLFQRGQESSGFSRYTFYYIHQKTLYFLYSGECVCLFRLLLPPPHHHFMLEDIWAFVLFTLVGSEYLL